MPCSFSTKLTGFCFIAAPLLFGLSTFYWQNGDYGITAGMLLALATVFWVVVFIALFHRLQDTMPYYGTIGLVLAIYGCISGANFGLVGVFSEAFGISHEGYLQAAANYPLAFNLLLFWPGPLFPLSLLVLGIVLALKKQVPVWAGILLCLGAIAFPLSRIPRIEVVAHVADLLLAIPLWYMGYRYIEGRRPERARPYA